MTITMQINTHSASQIGWDESLDNGLLDYKSVNFQSGDVTLLEDQQQERPLLKQYLPATSQMNMPKTFLQPMQFANAIRLKLISTNIIP